MQYAVSMKLYFEILYLIISMITIYIEISRDLYLVTCNMLVFYYSQFRESQ